MTLPLYRQPQALYERREQTDDDPDGDTDRERFGPETGTFARAYVLETALGWLDGHESRRVGVPGIEI